MDGLIHISELSWGHVNHPSEVLEIGQEVKVKVLDIDRERQRISLGLKQTQSDPWQQVLDSYSLNDVVDGKVTKVVTFGAFVEILPGVEGLVHISELAQHHVENPREVVAQGQVVQVKIIEMDAERRRLSLSLKRVEDGEAAQPRAEDAPPLALSEEVFSDDGPARPTRPRRMPRSRSPSSTPTTRSLTTSRPRQKPPRPSRPRLRPTRSCQRQRSRLSRSRSRPRLRSSRMRPSLPRQRPSLRRPRQTTTPRDP